MIGGIGPMSNRTRFKESQYKDDVSVCGIIEVSSRKLEGWFDGTTLKELVCYYTVRRC